MAIFYIDHESSCNTIATGAYNSLVYNLKKDFFYCKEPHIMHTNNNVDY